MTEQKPNNQGKQIWNRSVVVGLILFSLGLLYRINGAPSDQNVWAIAYGVLGFFFLWPYQLVLTFRLRRFDGDISKYLGIALSVASIGFAVGI